MFSGFYSLSDAASDKDVERRWARYRAAQLCRADDVETRESLSLTSVIESLADARADLDVLIDIASLLGDEQHLGVAHVPQSVVAEVQRQRTLQMLLKKRQLQDIATRLKAGAAVLRSKYCSQEDAFASDLSELQRRWPTYEYKPGTAFVDCALVSTRFALEDNWDWLNPTSLGKHTFVIARDQNDDAAGACAVIQKELCCGWEAIDAELRAIRSKRAWKLIQAALEEEAVAIDGMWDGDVQRAVLALSRASSSVMPLDLVCRDVRMLYVENFCRTDLCRSLFRQRGMLVLRDAMTWHTIPEIIRQTTRTKHASFMEQLCKWLSFSAMWFDIAESLPENDPWKEVLLAYIIALGSSSRCVPAQIILGSTQVSIDEGYSMSTSTSTIGRLQLKELVMTGGSGHMSF